MVQEHLAKLTATKSRYNQTQYFHTSATNVQTTKYILQHRLIEKTGPSKLGYKLQTF